MNGWPNIYWNNHKTWGKTYIFWTELKASILAQEDRLGWENFYFLILSSFFSYGYPRLSTPWIGVLLDEGNCLILEWGAYSRDHMFVLKGSRPLQLKVSFEIVDSLSKHKVWDSDLSLRSFLPLLFKRPLQWLHSLDIRGVQLTQKIFKNKLFWSAISNVTREEFSFLRFRFNHLFNLHLPNTQHIFDVHM